MWLSSKEFRKKYKITPQHLYALKKSGKIETKPSVGSSYLINDSFEPENRSVCVYGRVSTPKQTKDLDNQIMLIKEYCIANGENPEYVFSDIGSGMNESRNGLNKMLDLVIENKISKIVVSHKDRLTRFGFKYIENICNRFGTTIEIVNLDDDKSFQEELTDDLIAIIHHFSMRFYGKRRDKMKDLERTCKNELSNEDK